MQEAVATHFEVVELKFLISHLACVNWNIHVLWNVFSLHLQVSSIQDLLWGSVVPVMMTSYAWLMSSLWVPSYVWRMTSCVWLRLISCLSLVLNNRRLRKRREFIKIEVIAECIRSNLLLYDISILINILNRNLLMRRIILLLVNVSWLILLLISGWLFLKKIKVQHQ